jgi:predicted DNA-binding antitoxin AbrB/MazE fold protein
MSVMDQVITATFENGVLKPDQRLGLPPRSRVRLVVQAVETPDEAWEELQRLLKSSPINSGGDFLTRDQLHERR